MPRRSGHSRAAPRRSLRSPSPPACSSFCSFWLASAVASSISPSPTRRRLRGLRSKLPRHSHGKRPRAISAEIAYSTVFRERVKRVGIAEVITAARSPWQNPYVERVIGTIRRELLNHATLLDKRHLQRRLRAYVDYYHRCRTRLSLDKTRPRRAPSSRRRADPSAPWPKLVVSIIATSGAPHRIGFSPATGIYWSARSADCTGASELCSLACASLAAASFAARFPSSISFLTVCPPLRPISS